jgi:Zn-dependent peptidase ImmA (M78 family)
VNPKFNIIGLPKFKATKNEDPQQLMIATSLCSRIAELVASSCKIPYESFSNISVRNIRENILKKYGIVDSKSILAFCWDRGIPVFYCNMFPPKAKKFHGMAIFVNDRPVIVISLKDISPSRLLFIIVHELGHIYKAHISSDAPLMVDEKVDLDLNSDDEEEIEANEFAGELLFGKANMSYILRDQYKGQRLADCAQQLATRDKISPGLIAWNYGWSKGNQGKEQWGITRTAINILEPDANAPLEINQYLEKQIDWDRLSDDNQEHLHVFLELPGN